MTAIECAEQDLNEMLRLLSVKQMDFVAARMFRPSDAEAAQLCGLSAYTVYNWPNKDHVNEAVRRAKVLVVLTMPCAIAAAASLLHEQKESIATP